MKYAILFVLAIVLAACENSQQQPQPGDSNKALNYSDMGSTLGKIPLTVVDVTKIPKEKVRTTMVAGEEVSNIHFEDLSLAVVAQKDVKLPPTVMQGMCSGNMSCLVACGKGKILIWGIPEGCRCYAWADNGIAILCGSGCPSYFITCNAGVIN